MLEAKGYTLSVLYNGSQRTLHSLNGSQWAMETCALKLPHLNTHQPKSLGLFRLPTGVLNLITKLTTYIF